MLESEQIRIEGDILVLALKGRLTLGSRLSQLEAEVKSLAEIGKRKVILDLEEIEYADSAALGVLLHSTVFLRNKGGRLLLAGPNQRLQDLFTLTNTTPLLNIAADRAAAIAELG
jgi:anti-anti-sigma factor